MVRVQRLQIYNGTLILIQLNPCNIENGNETREGEGLPITSPGNILFILLCSVVVFTHHTTLATTVIYCLGSVI